MQTLSNKPPLPNADADPSSDLFETDLPMWDDFTYDEDWLGDAPYAQIDDRKNKLPN